MSSLLILRAQVHLLEIIFFCSIPYHSDTLQNLLPRDLVNALIFFLLSTKNLDSKSNTGFTFVVYGIYNTQTST